jgi:hypothetical protein
MKKSRAERLDFVFFFGQDPAGLWRWALAQPDGGTVLASCSGPSASRRACLNEVRVIRQMAFSMKVVEWKDPGIESPPPRRPKRK